MKQKQTTQTSYFGKIPKCKACHNDIWIEGFACKCGKSMKFERVKLFTLVRMDNYSTWQKKTKQELLC